MINLGINTSQFTKQKLNLNEFENMKKMISDFKEALHSFTIDFIVS